MQALKVSSVKWFLVHMKSLHNQAIQFTGKTFRVSL